MIELVSHVVFVTALRPACTFYICVYSISFTYSYRVQFLASLMVKECIYTKQSGEDRLRVALISVYSFLSTL